MQKIINCPAPLPPFQPSLQAWPGDQWHGTKCAEQGFVGQLCASRIFGCKYDGKIQCEFFVIKHGRLFELYEEFCLENCYSIDKGQAGAEISGLAPFFLDLLMISCACLQYTEEQFGKSEKTEFDARFESLAERADKTKLWAERMSAQTELLLQPNPGNYQNEGLLDSGLAIKEIVFFVPNASTRS